MDLLKWAQPVLSTLPTIDDARDEVTLTAPLGLETKTLITRQLIIEKSMHGYGDHLRVDMVVFLADQTVFGALGLALLEACLTGDNVTIKLTHPKSQIQEILLRGATANRSEEMNFNFNLTTFGYWPMQPYETVQNAEIGDHYNWPHFEYWPISETALYVSGSALGLLRLVQIWLDTSQPDAHHSEMNLELPVIGIGGVSPNSAEVKFLMPDSDLWPGYDLSVTDQ